MLSMEPPLQSNMVYGTRWRSIIFQFHIKTIKDYFTFINHKSMEFKEFGPLEQSKEIAENKKATWGTVLLMVGFGALAVIVYSNIISQHYRENQFRMTDKS